MPLVKAKLSTKRKDMLMTTAKMMYQILSEKVSKSESEKVKIVLNNHFFYTLHNLLGLLLKLFSTIVGPCPSALCGSFLISGAAVVVVLWRVNVVLIVTTWSWMKIKIKAWRTLFISHNVACLDNWLVWPYWLAWKPKSRYIFVWYHHALPRLPWPSDKHPTGRTKNNF